MAKKSVAATMKSEKRPSNVKHSSPCSKIVKMFDYLAARWEDESEYEDFNDYIKQMKKCVNSAGAIFVELKKQPFVLVFKTVIGFVFTVRIDSVRNKIEVIQTRS